MIETRPLERRGNELRGACARSIARSIARSNVREEREGDECAREGDESAQTVASRAAVSILGRLGLTHALAACGLLEALERERVL